MSRSRARRMTAFTYKATAGDDNGYLDTITDAMGRVVQFAYDGAGRVTSQTFQPATPDERVITYAYDANGNLTSISTGASFGYDAHNRMSQANLPGGLSVQYLYNGDGLKLRRTEGSAVTRYYHDGIKPIYEANSAGSLQAQLERDIFGNLLARKTSNGTWYYHHDGLGSTVGLTDAAGAVAAQRTYDAWGNRRTSSGSAPGNYQFTGAELDPTSGFYHMGARFYDPAIGRWLSEDPVQGEHFDPETLNYYAYVNSNPLLLVDPDGAIALVAAVAAGLSASALGPIGLAVGITIVGGILLGLAADEARQLIIHEMAQREKKQVSGLAKELAIHLADFLGRSVGGFSPRPGKDRRDPKKFLEQAKGYFKQIWDKVGRDLKKFERLLRDQGWSEKDIKDLIKAMQDAGLI